MLVGVGLGPGDPELLTLRAVRLLREAKAVFVPGKLAYDLVRPYRADAVVLKFPMTNDEGYIRRCLEENADRIAPHAMEGLAVFGILGDPNFYSTFSRLAGVIAERHPGVSFATEPGVSSITAFASVANVPVSGRVLVSDGNGEESRVIMKVRRPAAVAADLREEGFSEFVLVERMFMPEERVYRGDELPEESDYFSILFARRSHE